MGDQANGLGLDLRSTVQQRLFLAAWERLHAEITAGRAITLPALAMDAPEKLDDCTLSLKTPPDPRTGASRVVLDPLEWIHRITVHIPDPGRHCQRFYGDCSNPCRVPRAPGEPTIPIPGSPPPSGTIPISRGRAAAHGLV